MDSTAFTDLGVSQSIAQALAEHNITQPTEIQRKTIPSLLAGKKDFIGLAQTGTGKTIAFGLPLLQHIHEQQKGVQALVLAPTRELVQQIARQLSLFSRSLPRVVVRAVYGGTPLAPQINTLRRVPQILVATPGRLVDLVERKVIRLGHVTSLVLDEADEMFSMGFQPTIHQIISFLPREKSIWLFSATMPRAVGRLVHEYMAKDHVQVEISPRSVVNPNIEHKYLVCAPDTKQNSLRTLLNTFPDKLSLIFCKTKATTQRVAQNLTKQGMRVGALHGDLSQNRRDKVMRSFKNRQIQALVATDVAARGIDVKRLYYVIHYDLPTQFEYYTHRSGRTARAGNKGVSVCLVTRQELKTVRRISKVLGIHFKSLQSTTKEGV